MDALCLIILEILSAIPSSKRWGYLHPEGRNEMGVGESTQCSIPLLDSWALIFFMIVASVSSTMPGS